MQSQRVIEFEECEAPEEMSNGVDGIFTPLGVIKLTSENSPLS